MATEKRELILDLLARNKGGPAVKSFADDVDKLGTAAEKAGKSTEGLGKKSDQTAKETAKLGRSATDAQGKVDDLGDEIRKLEQDLVLLAGAFADTQDKAERLDLAKGIRKSQAEIRQLTKTRGILEGILPDPEPVVQSFTSRLISGIGKAGPLVASTARGFATPVGAAIGVGIAEVALPALSAAMVAGAGAAGLGAGIALAISKDKALQSTAKRIGLDFINTLQDSATKNLGGPIRQAFSVIDDAADRSAGKISKAFGNLGPALLPLTQDLVAAVERILDSITGMASKSGPALAGLGDSARLVADGIGSFMDSLADGAAEGADSLVLISGAMADLLKWTGGTLKLFNDLANNAWVTGPLLPLLKKHYREAADATQGAIAPTEEHADAMVYAERAARGELDALKGLSDELKAQSDPVFGLLDAQDKLAEAQTNAAEATKKHGANSKEAEKANRDLAKAAIDLEGKVGALGTTFNGEMTPALKATLRAAGVTEGTINDLARQFRAARRDGDRFAKTYRAKVITEYISKYTTIVSGSAESAYERTRRQIAGRRATGGPVEKDRPYWVGENGPELMVPERNGRVLSATQSQRAVQSAKLAGGTGTARVVLDVTGAEGKFKDWIRYMIRTQNLLQG